MRSDPYIAFNYRVEIGQVIVAGFSEVSGLSFETEVETFREGGANAQEVQLPGVSKLASKIVLKRGLGDKHDLWDWYSQIRDGDIQRKDVAITMLDHAGETARRWTFRQACPVKWTGPELKAQVAGIAFESVELIHRGLLSTS